MRKPKKLPITHRKSHEPKHFSMDEYYRFVITNLKRMTPKAREAMRRLKRKMLVNIPFKL